MKTIHLGIARTEHRGWSLPSCHFKSEPLPQGSTSVHSSLIVRTTCLANSSGVGTPVLIRPEAALIPNKALVALLTPSVPESRVSLSPRPLAESLVSWRGRAVPLGPPEHLGQQEWSLGSPPLIVPISATCRVLALSSFPRISSKETI